MNISNVNEYDYTNIVYVNVKDYICSKLICIDHGKST